MSSAPKNRRQCVRFRFALEVEDPQRGLKAVTRDISSNGMFVSGLPCELGRRVTLGVRFPESPLPLRVAGDVVRVERDGRDVALSLVYPAQATQLQFEGHVRGLSLARTEPGWPPPAR